MIIGIDIGSSTIKILAYKNKEIINKQITTNLNVKSVLEEYIKKNNIEIKEVEKIVATGIGVNKLEEKIYNVPIQKIDEFKAIATGGLYLTKKEEALIVSIGTGTAFIRASKNEIKHLGGTRCWCWNTNKSMQ